MRFGKKYENSTRQAIAEATAILPDVVDIICDYIPTVCTLVPEIEEKVYRQVHAKPPNNGGDVMARLQFFCAVTNYGLVEAVVQCFKQTYLVRWRPFALRLVHPTVLARYDALHPCSRQS